MDTIIIPISHSCRFHLGDEPNAWQSWFNDSEWQKVTLPHDWSVTLPFSRDYSSGTGYLAGGIGWYRIPITPKKEWQGHQISIHFDGIYRNSRVWCNSYYLGERPNGYISFSYDITQQFRFDAENIITVFVDHREIADSRWFTGSGITRKVSLVIEDAIHPVKDGIFFSTPKVSEAEASYLVENEIINTKQEACTVTVTNLLFAKNGELVAESRKQTTIPAGQTMSIETQGIVKRPLLWSPKEPNLYTLKTYIAYGNHKRKAPSKGTVTTGTGLSSTQQVGIRSFRFHPDKGFSLNGHPYVFKGVCIHHDAGCLGAVVPSEVWHRRLMKLREMGCNAIRMSHNPHMPELYDLCDSLGFFVIDEAFDEWEAPKNKWSKGYNVHPPKHHGYYTDFPTWHERDLIDLIRRDRNHPSIIIWSIGNEIDYPNDPYSHASFCVTADNEDSEHFYNASRPNASRLPFLAKHLCDIAKKTDTTRPVTLAVAFPESSAKLGFIDSLDVVGFNYKEHLYKEYHEAFPDKPFLGSENGHTYNQWRAVTDNDYISGQFLWTGIDYLGEAYGWPIHGSSSGLLTLAGFEKTSYYRRQSFWSEKPMVHLATIRKEDSTRTTWGEEYPTALACEFSPVSECWDYIPGEMIVIKCYTNLEEAEFFLNKKSIGIYKKEAYNDCILLTIPFEPGELLVHGIISSGRSKRFVTHCLKSTNTACQMQLVAYPTPGSTLKQIEVTMCDFKGNRVYHDSTMLKVAVENGTLVGLENGDLADITDYTFTSRRAYRGQLLIYAVPKNASQKMTVHVEGEQIKKAVITI